MDGNWLSVGHWLAAAVALAILVAFLKLRQHVNPFFPPFEEPWRIRKGPTDGMED